VTPELLSSFCRAGQVDIARHGELSLELSEAFVRNKVKGSSINHEQLPTRIENGDRGGS